MGYSSPTGNNLYGNHTNDSGLHIWKTRILTSSCTTYISIEHTEGAGVHLHPEIRGDYCVEASLVSRALDRFVDYCNRG